MPGHREPSVSVIEQGGEQLKRMRVEDVKTPIDDIFEEMWNFGMINDTLNKD